MCYCMIKCVIYRDIALFQGKCSRFPILSTILSLNEKTGIRENPYPGIFYAVLSKIYAKDDMTCRHIKIILRFMKFDMHRKLWNYYFFHLNSINKLFHQGKSESKSPQELQIWTYTCLQLTENQFTGTGKVICESINVL